MKKIIALITAVMMSCSVFCAIPAFASSDALITDAADSTAVEFKNYIENNGLVFDENYFFVGEVEEEENRENGGLNLGVEISVTSDVELTFGVGVDFYENGMAGVPVFNWEKFEEERVVSATAKKDSPALIPIATSYTYDTLLPMTVGVSIQNSSDLTEDVTVTVDIVAITEEVTAEDNKAVVTYTKGDVIGTLEKEFAGPITFVDEDGNLITNLIKMGNVLTSLREGANVEYAVLANALADITESEITALNAKLDDSTKAKLDRIMRSGIPDEKIVNADGNVTLPYITLAGNGTEYAVEVAEVTAPTNHGKDDAVAYDVTLKVDGIEVNKPIASQKVLVTLPNGWDSTTVVYQHEGENSWTSANVIDGNIVVESNSFSEFRFAADLVEATESNRADVVKFDIIQDSVNKNKFALVIAPTDSDEQIIKFATAGIKYEFRTDGIAEDEVMKNLTFDYTEAAGIKITNRKEIPAGANSIGGFSFVANAADGNLITVEKGEYIKVADLEITGKGKIYVASGDLEGENVAYCETEYNNEISRIKVQSTYNNPTLVEIPELKYDLTINVDFGLNRVETTDADYLGMKVTLVGDISGEETVLTIGDELAITLDEANKTAFATGKVNLPVDNYLFKIEGLGYRTYRDYVYLDTNKTINLWNNAIDDGTTINVVADDDSTAKKVTFLVGDIYMDGIVDIYDLSAATSYYGAENIDKANTNVYACDLNRDGKITIADIAYVQVSYGN